MGVLFDSASKELQSDKQVILEAVKQNGRALQYAPKELQSDKEMVLEATLKQNGRAFNMHPKELQSDKEVVLIQHAFLYQN